MTTIALTIAATLATAAPSREASALASLTRIATDADQPSWKRFLCTTAARRLPPPMTFKPTWYSSAMGDGDSGVGASWPGGKAGLPLRWGHCAAGKAWPLGTVFYCDELRLLLIVVDRGGKVKGKRRVDVFVPHAAALGRYGEATRTGGLTLRHLETVKYEQAR